MTKCFYCTRKAEHEFSNAPAMCDICAKVFRDAFQKGRVYERESRRKGFRPSECRSSDNTQHNAGVISQQVGNDNF